MGKHAKLKGKQKWSNEKVHLENEGKLREIYFIEQEDKEFKETIKNARKKLETPIAQTRGKSNDFKFKFAYILEGSESTRMRMEES